jgi:hypothetical protein
VASLDEVQAVLGELGRAYGASGLALDESGDCSLLVNQRVPVAFHFDEVGQSLVLESQVGQLPAANPEPVLELAARGNRLGDETLGGTLALGPDGQILLMRELGLARLPLATLERALAEQVEAAEYWQRRLEGGPGAAAGDELMPPHEMFDPGRLA